MQSVEITAPTLEEARRAAAFQLGVPEEQIEVEILNEPRRLLGLLSSGQYTIRASYDEQLQVEPAPLGEPETEATYEVSASEAEAPVAGEREVTGPQVVSDAAEQLMPPAAPREQPDDPKQAVAERAKQVTEQIAALMGVDAQVTITEVGPAQVKLSIGGDAGLGLLVGQYGNTLDALQLVVAIAANKGITNGCRVILDTAGGYRARHEEDLQRRAHEAAEEAKRTGREVVIADLKSYERRVMHMALVDDPDVETYSEGEGRDRCLVVSPIGPE